MSHISTLNPPRAVYSVIGSLCKNPQLLRETEVTLSEDDFSQEFHKVIFSAINNLIYQDLSTTRVTEIDIDNYLASYPKLYKIWEKYNGLKYVNDCIENTNIEMFMQNYSRLKKFSLLRHYVNNGIDVSDLIDYQSTDLADQEKGMKTIDDMDIHDIIDHYTMRMIDTRNSFNISQESRDFRAGEDIDQLLEKLNASPEFGLPFKNGLYNAVFRGMRKEKFLLRSAGTGTGKSRMAIADLCNVSCTEIYDIDQDKWVSNGPAYPTLYISTEIEKEEIQSIMIAFVSGINEKVIKDGYYSEKVLARLKKAIEIVKRAPIYCVYVDDFSISDIEMIIEQHIIQHNVVVVSFDYVQLTAKLSRTMANSFGSNLREDQILVQFTASLKNLATKYKVFLESSTQLNRNSNDAEMRDTSSLRGGSASADKIDHGIQTYKVTNKDLTNLKHIIEQGFDGDMKPNYSHWVYKNRSGLSDVIIWSKMDLGNMRETPLFVTDKDYNLLEVQPIQIEYK